MSPEPIFRVALRGEEILTSPRWNKGTAFTMTERKAFGLTGRLPYRVNSLDEQCDRAYDQLEGRDAPLRKNTFLQSMRDQNWVLYYSLISRHLKELIPIIYTPTEADAISNYSHLFRRSEGMYLTFPSQDSMEEDFLEQTKGREIDLIVCSDAEAILGIGDQGVGGIGISTAKSAIYTLLAGMDPSKTLSVTLDVGTNNENLLDDRLYVGWPHHRVRGEEYDKFIDKFVQLVRKHHPHSLLHFEDFGVGNAKRLLDLYRDKHAVFKDDVQGTGAVTLACVMSAVGVTKTKLTDQRFVIYEVVKKVRPTVLIGCSTQPGAFTEEIVREMAKHCERPIILPLSNPSRLHEVTPQQANDWTQGKALIATGSPFPACKMPNGKDYIIAECNNALIYPGLGFGAMLAQSRTLTDTMIIAGARRLAQLAPALQDPDDALLPDFGDAPTVNFEVAVAVAEQAIEEGSAGVDWKKEDVEAKVREKHCEWAALGNRRIREGFS
ncbi:putative NAD-dependent malic enzyme 2 [Grifola frondosa]|uniref:Malic enzyme n=1 Tax=Grifola frondosa TaxID=5627 RepID=A0A1C7LV17_GRIFR|nr:putative NAD-dependent malic enzyme 2 [Grifola frondosa]